MNYSKLFFIITLSSLGTTVPLNSTHASFSTMYKLDEEKAENLNRLIQHMENFEDFLKDYKAYMKKSSNLLSNTHVENTRNNIRVNQKYVDHMKKMKEGVLSVDDAFILMADARIDFLMSRTLYKKNARQMIVSDHFNNTTTGPSFIPSTDPLKYDDLNEDGQMVARNSKDMYQVLTHAVISLYGMLDKENMSERVREKIAQCPTLWPLMRGESDDFGHPDLPNLCAHSWDDFQDLAFELDFIDTNPGSNVEGYPSVANFPYLGKINFMSDIDLKFLYDTEFEWEKTGLRNGKKIPIKVRTTHYERSLVDGKWRFFKKFGPLPIPEWLSAQKKNDLKIAVAKKTKGNTTNQNRSNQKRKNQNVKRTTAAKKNPVLKLDLQDDKQESTSHSVHTDVVMETSNAALEDLIEISNLQIGLSTLEIENKSVSNSDQDQNQNDNIVSDDLEEDSSSKTTSKPLELKNNFSDNNSLAIQRPKKVVKNLMMEPNQSKKDNKGSDVAPSKSVDNSPLPPRGMRLFHANAMTQYRSLIEPNQLTGSQYKTWMRIFDPQQYTKVRYGKFASLWRHINGPKSIKESKGTSHKELKDADGLVVAGTFSHGDGMTYTLRTIPYIRDALNRIGFGLNN